MFSIPMCRVMLVWIVLLASVSIVLARVADVSSDTPGDLPVTLSTDFLPELTASEPPPSITEAVLGSTASASSFSATGLSTVPPASASGSDAAPTMSIQPCGSRGMRPCPQGQQCTYGKVAKLGFIQDLPGQCGAVDGLL
ncbi:MAG: hypothetical protein LQ337_001790 [Flavoplaca oasis]|nr:MAG: hypothetical protein LQ337_001790 [Flavoplaca oasis]